MISYDAPKASFFFYKTASFSYHAKGRAQALRILLGLAQDAGV